MSDEHPKPEDPSTPEEEPACASCGKHHRSPYPKQLVDTFHQLKKETNRDKRLNLMDAIAAMFVEAVDPTDCGLTEATHESVEAYHEALRESEAAHHAFEEASLRLARMVVRGLQQEERDLVGTSGGGTRMVLIIPPGAGEGEDPPKDPEDVN
jgi:hypothetical protein